MIGVASNGDASSASWGHSAWARRRPARQSAGHRSWRSRYRAAARSLPCCLLPGGTLVAESSVACPHPSCRLCVRSPFGGSLRGALGSPSNSRAASVLLSEAHTDAFCRGLSDEGAWRTRWGDDFRPKRRSERYDQSCVPLLGPRVTLGVRARSFTAGVGSEGHERVAWSRLQPAQLGHRNGCGDELAPRADGSIRVKVSDSSCAGSRPAGGADGGHAPARGCWRWAGVRGHSCACASVAEDKRCA